MQSRAFCRGTPHVYRVVKTAPATARTMSLFPRSFGFPVPQSSSISHPFTVSTSLDREIAPFFRMMEDLNRQFDSSFFPFANPASRLAAPATPFAPRFDVREVEGAYELRGELPGVEASNLQVEFTDPHTLVIRGRTESETSSGTPPPAIEAKITPTLEAAEPSSTTNAVADDAASTHSTPSYHKATVEDDVVAQEHDSASTPGQATPAESVTEEPTQSNAVHTNANTTEVKADNNDNTPAESNGPRYWVSERRTGSFQRVFNFSTKVDQEGVTASLKNGVLNVVVPKAVQQAPRRITVQ